MTKFLFALVVGSGYLLGYFLYRQLVVEGEIGPAALLGFAALAILFAFMLTMYLLSKTRHRETVGKLLLAGFSLAGTYLIVDFVAGTIFIRPLSPALVPDEYRHHKLVPDSTSEIQQRDFLYRQHVNTVGLRGPEITVEKPPGTRRVLMLGDSFTMGKGVAEDETFSAIVEKILQDASTACGGPRIEVLNGGVDSYAPVLSLLQLKRDLAPLSPDLVVLNLDNSDLVQEDAYRRQAVKGPEGEIVAVPQVSKRSAYERLHSWTARHLFFTRVILVNVTRAFEHGHLTVRQAVNEMGREYFAHTLEGDIDRTEEWREVFDSVGRIKALADAQNMQFLLTTYPWAHQLGDTGWVPGRYQYMKPGERTTDQSARTIRKNAEALGIELLEMEPYFRSYKGIEALYFSYDPHWTAAGQRVMGQGLAAYISEHYLAQWCPDR